MPHRIVVLAGLVAACATPTPLETVVFVAPAQEAVAAAFVAQLPPELVAGVRVADDPAAAMASSVEGERRIALVVDGAACEGCYRLEAAAGGVIARGDAPLGVQYGVAHWLESMGVRFFHPSRTFVPAELALPDPSIFGVEHAPQIAERGLQLHVLHPIEAYFDFWEPGPENLAGAERTLHWLVCNRGNFVSWPSLGSIGREAERAPWMEHTRAILDAAHLRGVRVGLGVQLFGRSSLQNAFVLVPDEAADPATQMAERLDPIAPLPFDGFTLSFGEFFGADPDAFVSTVELAYDAIHARWPDAEVSASVHVGDFPDTRVSYRGEELLYYFLVRYAERPIVPWIHTVMYYDLYEPAGGAYNHADFAEHREYLLSELGAHRPVGYHPETAYWVAFDNSVPTYLPLYVRSRWLDLTETRRLGEASGASPLGSHVVFSSGWEWGYWQNDVAVLRMSYALPDRWQAVLEEQLAPLPGGPALASSVTALAELEHDALMEGGLAAYLASTDLTFALGLAMDFWSQPRRPEIAEVATMDAAALDDFERDVVVPLGELRDALDAIPTPAGEDPFVAETRDGVEIDRARARFAAAIWAGALALGRGQSAAPHLEAARAARAEAEVVVRRRHAALHDPDGAMLVQSRVPTAGLYDYGYLREADTLCYYDRELTQLENAAAGTSRTVPGCVL